ncbi:uncharacterized protein N7525_003876 [Penicillium rubens]|uniref:uncharacterized protein n=1 Tax=Penicillium rubens TaxID=1108849 RepID=UPI002A5A257B|nr:uncharacterized protein N7525_003876 [Penicillium rubens]KAJ5838688.1 hypothetical protein N7525_003876 [Penicillium rubens]
MISTYIRDRWGRPAVGVIRCNKVTPTPEHKEDAPKRQAIVLDCEMVTVGVVADMFTGDILINHFVNPTSIVRNWQTKYSGIICAAMKAAVEGNITIRGWKAARTQDHNDLNTPRLDTSILTADAVYRPLERPFRRTWKLKTLADELVGQKIQGGKRDHSALEDTMATREVLLYCTRNPLGLEAWAEKARSQEPAKCEPETTEPESLEEWFSRR